MVKKVAMRLTLALICVAFLSVFAVGCSDDDDTSPNSHRSGNILLDLKGGVFIPNNAKILAKSGDVVKYSAYKLVEDAKGNLIPEEEPTIKDREYVFEGNATGMSITNVPLGYRYWIVGTINSVDEKDDTKLIEYQAFEAESPLVKIPTPYYTEAEVTAWDPPLPEEAE